MLQCLVRAVCATFLIVTASPSFALVSICSGELLPEAGADAVRHEVIWDDFDSWFSDADVEMYTLVEGSATFEREDAYVLGQGGSALHVAPIQVEGQYTVSGYVRLAYPQAWGIDGSFGSACDSWHGVLTAVLANQEATSTDISNWNENSTSILVCPNSATAPCLSEGSAPPVIGGDESSTIVRPPTNRVEVLQAAQGLIYAIDETGLVLQTPNGYLTYHFKQDYTVTRHTVVSVSELQPGDVINAITERGADGSLEVVGLNVYRDQPRELQQTQIVASSEMDTQAPADNVGGVLKELNVQQSKGGEIRVTSGERELVLKLSPLIDATVVRSATFSDITSIPGYVRVVAAPQDDGTQNVRALELHW